MRGRKLTNAINLLEEAELMASARAGFTLTEPVEVEEAVRRAVEIVDKKERTDRTRVEMMRGYAETCDCRRQFLLSYFGESLPEPCGNFDCCRCRDRIGRTRRRYAVGGGHPGPASAGLR